LQSLASGTEHGITCAAYSFLVKLAQSDFYSPLRLSNTRPFPPPRDFVPRNWRNDPPPGVFTRSRFFSMVGWKTKIRAFRARLHPFSGRPRPFQRAFLRGTSCPFVVKALLSLSFPNGFLRGLRDLRG
jgi:hypothetical protein